MRTKIGAAYRGATYLHCEVFRLRTQFRVDTEQLAADLASLRAAGVLEQ